LLPRNKLSIPEGFVDPQSREQLLVLCGLLRQRGAATDHSRHLAEVRKIAVQVSSRAGVNVIKL
jgi:DNA-binding IclR family transcriptional regulator